MLPIFSTLSLLLNKRLWIILACICCTLCMLSSACSNNNKNLLHTKTFRIAKDNSWYPLNLMGKEKNMSAFVADLLLEIAKEAKFKIEIITTNTDNLHQGLEVGTYDGIITSVNPSANLVDQYTLSDPFYLLGPVLIVVSSSHVHTLEEMEGKIIGIKAGLPFAYNTKLQPSVLIIPYENMTTALEDLERNKIDGVIMESLPAYVYINGLYKGKEKVITAPLTNTGLRLMSLKTPTGSALIEGYNEGLKAVRENGTYQALLNKWNLVDTNPILAKNREGT